MLSILLKKFAGCIGIAMVILLAIALITYDRFDPSISNISNQQYQVKNFLGFLGANIADIVLQSIGISIILPMIFLLIISIKLTINAEQKYIILRTTLLLYVVFFISYLLSLRDSIYIPHGGFIGDYIRHFIPETLNVFWCNCAMILLIMFLTCICCGFNVSHWRQLIQMLYKVISFIYLLSKITSTKLIIRNKNIVKSNYPQVIKKVKKIMQKTNKNLALPTIDLLYEAPESNDNINLHEINFKEYKEKLINVLKDYGVYGEIINYNVGPVVTLYEFQPHPGTKSSRVISLANDISRSMCAKSTRVAVIAGKNALGIEIPNKERSLVYLKTLIKSNEYKNSVAHLPIIIGNDITGNAVVVDLTRMPHLLVAGTTGSGKSVGINTLILSILYSRTASQCRLVMIDPKMLELSVYNGIPHLLSPVVTDSKKAIGALKWVVQEMENRYRSMATAGVRNINGYNELIRKCSKKNTNSVYSVNRTNKNIGSNELPYIVVIVDEMADLMLVAGKEIESYIQRIAQMARASGIHLVMATQRPSVDVITGIIKANFPSRISFHVTSKIDSRTIIGEQGAEQLLGMGDMLCMMTGGVIKRVHGPFVSDDEIKKVVNKLKHYNDVNYKIDLNLVETKDTILTTNKDCGLYKQAVQAVITENRPTTNYLQKRFKISYNKAALLIEKMEIEKVISAANTQGKRKILQK